MGGPVDVSNRCNGYFGNYGASSSSPCGDDFYFYNYDSCDDSDDYCGGYGYLDCGSDVYTTPCDGDYFDYGHGTYLYADCDGQDQKSTSFGVYSPCYGYGYGSPCGPVDVSNRCNGYFGNYGASSSSPCGDDFYFYNYDSCDDSDDYCGGYLGCVLDREQTSSSPGALVFNLKQHISCPIPEHACH